MESSVDFRPRRVARFGLSLSPITRADVMKHVCDRLTAGFEYVGPPMNKQAARLLLGG